MARSRDQVIAALESRSAVDLASLRHGTPAKKPKSGLSSDLDAAVEAMKNVPWTVLEELKGDPNFLKKIGERMGAALRDRHSEVGQREQLRAPAQGHEST